MVGDCVLAALVATSALVPGESVVFSDSTLADSDWELIVVATQPGASASVEQVLSNGCPGAYRKITIDVPADESDWSEVCTFHHRKGAVHDPATDGAVAAVDYEDCGHYFAGPTRLWIGAALRQAGTIYVGPMIGLPDLEWLLNGFSPIHAGGFSAIDSTGDDLIDETRHPDFSETGAPLELGFVRFSNHPPESEGHTSISGVDNWRLELELVSQTPVSETTWGRLKARFD